MSSRLVIERIATEVLLRENATAEDLTVIERFGSVSRRMEALAWRAIVRRVLGVNVEIFYDDYGAPKVNKEDVYISVSHSKEWVAVLFSDTPCAVDIDYVERDFCRVANRYLSENEQIIAEQNGMYAEMWCAKEALYKYYKKGNLDLVKHISIGDYDSDRGVLRCSILGSEPIDVKIKRDGNFAIAVID